MAIRIRVGSRFIRTNKAPRLDGLFTGEKLKAGRWVHGNNGSFCVCDASEDSGNFWFNFPTTETFRIRNMWFLNNNFKQELSYWSFWRESWVARARTGSVCRLSELKVTQLVCSAAELASERRRLLVINTETPGSWSQNRKRESDSRLFCQNVKLCRATALPATAANQLLNPSGPCDFCLPALITTRSPK